MADKKLEILIDIQSKLDGLAAAQKGLASLEKSGTTATNSIQSVQDSLKTTSLAFAGITAAIGLFGKKAIAGAAQMEQFNVAFKTLTGDAGTAKKLLSDLTKFAATTPFELPQVVEGSKRLLAYNVAAKDIIPTFKTLGDIAAGVGTDKLPQLITAFGQVRAKGKLMGQELLQFTEAGVNLGQALIDTSKGTITSRTELEKLISAGKIGFPQVQAALDNLAKTKFANLMAKQSETLNGQLSNLNDAIGIFATQLGEALLPAVKLIVAGLIRLMSVFVGMPRPLKTLVAIVGALVFVFGTALTVATSLAYFWPSLKLGFELLTGSISKFIASLWASIVGMVRFAVQALYTSVVMIGSFVRSMVLGTLNALLFAVQLNKSIPALISFTATILKNAIPAMLSFGANAFKVGLQFLSGLVTPIVAGLKTIGIAIYTTPFIGWFALAIAAIIGLYFAFKNNFLGIKDIVTSVFKYISGIIGGMIEFVKGITDSVVQLTQKVLGIKKAVPAVDETPQPQKEVQNAPAPIDFKKEIDAHLEKENKKTEISAASLEKQRELKTQYENDVFTAELTALELKKEQQAQELTDLDAYYAAQYARTDLSEQQKAELEAAYLTKRNDIQKTQTDTEKKIMSERFGLAKTFFANLAVLSKEAAQVQKGIALGEAIFTTALAVIKALTLPFPANLVQAAYVGAQGAAQIATIQAQQFAKGTTDVPGTGSGDTVPSLLTPGEMVIPKSFAEGIRQGDVSIGAPQEDSEQSQGTEIIISLRDGLVDFIETEIIKRGRLGGTAIARTG